MLGEADIEQGVNRVVRDVQLLELLERLDASHFSQLAPGEVQNA